MNRIYVLSLPLLMVLVSMTFKPTNAQENWTRFRGPNGTGLSDSKTIPTKWTKDDYLWRTKLKGVGVSSPVVWKGKSFVTSGDHSSATLHLQCFSSAGKELWSKSFESKTYKLHRANSYAASTPAVDSDHVYIMLANPEQTLMIALDHDGNEKWRRDFGKWVCSHGFGTSPILHKDMVIFCNLQKGDEKLREGQSPGRSRITAVNRLTGKDVWETPVTTKLTGYSVPCIFESNGNDQLIGCNLGDGFFSLDPDTGKKNWSKNVFRLRSVSSVLVSGEMVYGSNGSGGGGNFLVAISPGQSTDEPVFEFAQAANYVPTAIAIGELLFLFGDRGVVSCLDKKTGAKHWQKRVSKKGFYGSPVATKTDIYVVDASGEAIVLKASKEFAITSKISLEEESHATPAIAGDRIYFRTQQHLICLGEKENSAAKNSNRE